MGKPIAADRAVPPKTQATRKGVKFKVSQEPLLTAPSSDAPHADASVVAEMPPSSPSPFVTEAPEHPNGRNDQDWHKHTMWHKEGNKLTYKPVQMKPLTVDSIPLQTRTF